MFSPHLLVLMLSQPAQICSQSLADWLKIFLSDSVFAHLLASVVVIVLVLLDLLGI